MSKHAMRALPLLALAFAAAAAAQPAREAPDLPDSLPLNRIQVLGTHNSYSIGVDPRVLALLETRLPSMGKLAAQMSTLR